MSGKRAEPGRCPICLRYVQALSADHCHSSGRHRDFVCPSCNTGLGMFRDNTETLIRAAAYIEKHKALHSDKCTLTDEESMLIYERRIGRAV